MEALGSVPRRRCSRCCVAAKTATLVWSEGRIIAVNDPVSRYLTVVERGVCGSCAYETVSASGLAREGGP